jgi:hypothetical protein
MKLGRAVHVPETIAAALEHVFGERIDQVRVIEYSLFARLHACNHATTRRRRIYLLGSAADFFQNPWLMLHEYYHVLKQWETGALTVPRYMLESALRGYWRNRFEVEARSFADLNRNRLLAELSRSQTGSSSAQQCFPVVEATSHQRERRPDREGGDH